MRQVSLALAALMLVGCEQSTSTYATVSDARRANMFEKGWLPGVLPDSATRISITTEVDIGRCSGSFNLPKAEIANFQSLLGSDPLPFQYDAWREEIATHQKKGQAVFYYQSDRATFAFTCDVGREACEFLCG